MRFALRASGLLVAIASTVGALSAIGSVATGCNPDPPVQSQLYFERSIQPILQHSCQQQTTGCHTTDSTGNAVGNLDLSSFAAANRRHDLLVTYGPYSAQSLLMKVIGPQPLTISTLDGPVTVTTDIRHAAQAGLDITSDGYATLARWMSGGASEDNTGQASPYPTPTGPCATTIPTDPDYDPTADPGPNYQNFHDNVQPVLAKNCSAASCHGNQVADLQLTCGTTDAQIQWNAYIAAQFLSSPASGSEIVRRPLDPAVGGVYHEGGVIFTDPNDPDYAKLVAWANAVVATPGALDLPASIDTPEFHFFSDRVQPLFARKGCMFLGCHSPEMFHDLRLRGGSGGEFSLVATRRNYDMAKKMLALESPDPNVSRLVNKNLFPYDATLGPTFIGTRHRGGPLLEDVTAAAGHAEASDCASYAGAAVDTGDLSATPSYCIIIEWIAKERAAAIAAGTLSPSPISAIAYVVRPPNQDVPQAFDTYEPGASLHVQAASMDPTGATGAVTMGADKDVTAGCGLTTASADIRRPAVSWDGTQIAFAARTSATSPLSIYVMNSDGSSCTQQTDISPTDPTQRIGGTILIHDFDPAWAPDGRLVFASSRGAIGQSDVDYSGPTRTPAGLLPNANLYVRETSGFRELTFLLNEELSPSFMRDGRMIFTSEKRAPDFYQLAGRRMNLDGGDYHPLYGQRQSIGFEQLTEIKELANRNFIGIFSDKGDVASGGAVGVINRSLGPDQDNRNPTDNFYLHSLHLPDVGATGKPGATGIYRSPAPLPALSFLASYQGGCDVATCSGAYELDQVDEHTGARTTLVSVSGMAVVEAAAVYARTNFGVYASQLDEPNGATQIQSGIQDAHLEILDVPMLSSLLTTNTRIGRTLMPNATSVGLVESLPPPDVSTFAAFASADAPFVQTDAYGQLFVKRRRLGIVPTGTDGSILLHIPGGMPMLLELYSDPSQAPIATQLEETEVSPGEQVRSGFRSSLFNAQCGGCHGSISGQEVDVHLDPDVLTGASVVSPHVGELDLAPTARGNPFTVAP